MQILRREVQDVRLQNAPGLRIWPKDDSEAQNGPLGGKHAYGQLSARLRGAEIDNETGENPAMASNRRLQAASLTTAAILTIAASANATTYRTNAAGREFACPRTALPSDGSPRLRAAPPFQPNATILALFGVPRWTDDADAAALTVFPFDPLSAIADPHSGANAGPTTAPGGLDSRTALGPGSMSLIGAGLIGVGMLCRGRIFRK